MRILVTGATGVVGRRAVPSLIAAGHRVTATGRDSARRAALERIGSSVASLDLLDRDAVQRIVADHDAVINLATHMPSTAMRAMLPWAFRENDRIRREGSKNLADAVLATSVPRLIQESFAPVYADGGARWLDERAPQRPARYNRTVLDAEHSANRVSDAGRVGIVLRFAVFYGPDSRFLLDALKMLERGVSPLPGRPDAYISSISHDDAAAAVIAALDLPAGTYNVSDDEPLTRTGYMGAVADAFSLKRPKPMPGWMSRLMGSAGELLGRSQRMSNAKLRAHGWTPRYPSVREGFRAAAEVLRGVRTGEPGPALTGKRHSGAS